MVLGMHRSGTSTFAGVLHMNHIVMGTYQNFWPRPMIENPKGFYENYDFRLLNDKLLKFSGYDVRSYKHDIPKINLKESIFKKMKILIQNSNHKYKNWGWKDPRTCLTASHWISSLKSLNIDKDLKIVFIARKASSVARSLKNRNDLPKSKGLLIWEKYTKSALDICEKYNYPVHYSSFEDLLSNPKDTCDKLFNFLGKEYDNSIVDKFIDESISKSGHGDNIKYTQDVQMLEDLIYSKID